MEVAYVSNFDKKGQIEKDERKIFFFVMYL